MLYSDAFFLMFINKNIFITIKIQCVYLNSISLFSYPIDISPYEVRFLLFYFFLSLSSFVLFFFFPFFIIFFLFTWHLGPIYYFIYLDVMAVNTQL